MKKTTAFYIRQIGLTGLLFLCMKLPIQAQTLVGQTLDAVPGEVTTYDGQTRPHYGIKWTTDSWFPSAPTAWISSYGGIKFFTSVHCFLSIDLNGNINAEGQSFLINSEKVGIATTNPPAGYKLAVGGKIIAEELKVQVQNAWPDYVFTSGYKLMPLSELEKFVKANQHLPEVLNAKEIAVNGVAVGANQALLLKKIEEITLHLIELNKKVEQLYKENERLKKQRLKYK